jgi:hypothetical protein
MEGVDAKWRGRTERAALFGPSVKSRFHYHPLF